MNTRGGCVVSDKGKKNIHSICEEEEEEVITILAYINANGDYMPATVIFKEERVHTQYPGFA
jgi:hypothetical protein